MIFPFIPFMVHDFFPELSREELGNTITVTIPIHVGYIYCSTIYITVTIPIHVGYIYCNTIYTAMISSTYLFLQPVMQLDSYMYVG